MDHATEMNLDKAQCGQVDCLLVLKANSDLGMTIIYLQISFHKLTGLLGSGQ